MCNLTAEEAAPTVYKAAGTFHNAAPTDAAIFPPKEDDATFPTDYDLPADANLPVDDHLHADADVDGDFTIIRTFLVNLVAEVSAMVKFTQAQPLFSAEAAHLLSMHSASEATTAVRDSLVTRSMLVPPRKPTLSDHSHLFFILLLLVHQTTVVK